MEERTTMTKKEQLKKLYDNIKFCEDDKMVFGDGNPESPILFIGEAPGHDEVEQGKPFVGKAGHNLDGFLAQLDLDRTKMYITNAVKFRPTKLSDRGNTINRTPNDEEILRYRPVMITEIEIIKPKIIITLGKVPLKSTLNKTDVFISSVHGNLFKNEEFRCYEFSLYHPASIIYNQNLRSVYEKDIEKLKDVLSKI